MNEQQNFWRKEYSKDYIDKNTEFDADLGIDCWKKMLNKSEGVNSVLECGSNIGRNIASLQSILPNAEKSIIEISPDSYEIVTQNFPIKDSYNGSILESNFSNESFDLVYTCGVLIHIHPEDVRANMEKMFHYSRKYILIAEYFNRTPVMIEYQGEKDKLFKSDFGKQFIETFDVKLVDYGFLWGHICDQAGFDDMTWWLFEKNK
ncbi:hypothetical protein OAP06_04575 [Gammaproteobacteria bacterium]|nr:hypothetical protein [Gammaproteobacteria bacterium]